MMLEAAVKAIEKYNAIEASLMKKTAEKEETRGAMDDARRRARVVVVAYGCVYAGGGGAGRALNPATRESIIALIFSSSAKRCVQHAV